MTERMTVKSIGILSFATIYALIGAASGAIGGFFYGGIFALQSSPGADYPGWLILLFGTITGAMGYGLFAFIGALFAGLFLNFILMLTGGLSLKVEVE